MALGDLLSMLTMPQIGSLVSPTTPNAPVQAIDPSVTQSQSTPIDHPDGVAGPVGGLMPDGQTILGHHVNNLLQVTGNLAPPPGVSSMGDQTQANIPGGYTPPPSADQPMAHDHQDAVNGPFKTHGVFGSILGHLMDAALVSAGLPAEYTKRVGYAKQQDAIENRQADPTGAYNNLVGVSGLTDANAFQAAGNADVAAHNTAILEPLKLQAAANTAKATMLATQIKAQQQQSNLAGTLIGSDPKDPGAQAKAKVIAQQIRSMKAQYGDTSDVPDDVQGLIDFANRSITPEQRTTSQNTQDYHDAIIAARRAGIAIQQQRANTAASVAASGNALRSFRVKNPSYASDPQYRALKQQYLQGQLALQKQHLGLNTQRGQINSMMNGVADPLDDDDDSDDDDSGGIPAPAAAPVVHAAVPSGFKLQRNAKTGATRLVKQ